MTGVRKKISILESKEKIEDELLAEIAKILNVPEEAIRNFDEETAIYNIQNNYEGSNHGAKVINADSSIYQECTFNPLDKLMETMEEIKKLHAEKEALYERLLKALEQK